MKKPLLILLAMLALPLAGCAHVEPWERGVLAKPPVRKRARELAHLREP